MAFGSAPAAAARGQRGGRALGLMLALVMPGLAGAIGFDDVAERARELAAAAYKAPVSQLPAELRELDYDAYRDIRFRPDHALWRAEKLPFELMFFPTGRGFQDAVRINIVDPDGIKRLEFNPASFDFGRSTFDAQVLRSLGYAGFRVHYAINRPGYKDEVAVFLGASYFRAVGQNQVYGLSARGLAVDTAAGSGEEFPRFSEFWIERPRPAATTLTLYGLLDSKHATGAYKFVLIPGAETVVMVSSRLFPRDAQAKFGIAPLNTMFAFGENQPGRDDYRPEVHDSDGLSVQTGGGEWIWRPLVNPKRLLVTSFGTTDPRGFGMMQRDRQPTSYEDPEALYERRPSLWIEPIGAWGKGRVELVQIPSPDETNDNIVAYWVPEQALAVGKALDFNYRMRWQMNGQLPTGLGAVVQTRRGRGYVRQPDGDINFVVDFDGPALRALAPDTKLDAAIEVGANGELRERNLFHNGVSGAWRMTVRFKRADASKPVELRAAIKQAQNTLTETWSYIVPPESEKQ